MAAFRAFEKVGIHVVPNHFYAPVPDTRCIPQEFWEQPSSLVGIDLDEYGQLALLHEFQRQYKNEYDRFLEAAVSPSDFSVLNKSFGSVDAEILYCMIRYFKPNRIIEVGSGNSTLVSAKAVLKNAAENGMQATLTAVEPYPNPIVQRGFPGLSNLLKVPVQSVPLAEFESLEANDILFIDSSHVLKLASDVQYEFLEVLPRLKKGVIVHFHDIFLPFSYPKSWVVDEQRFWNEQYLLQAFLAFNRSFSVLWAGSYMNGKNPEALGLAFGSYDAKKTRPGSFWVKRVA